MLRAPKVPVAGPWRVDGGGEGKALAQVHLQDEFPGSPADVYAAAKDFAAYRRWLRDIRSVRVLEEGPGWQLSAWEVSWLGQIYSWRERDTFDDAACTIRSTLVESGFLDRLELTCRFQLTASGTRLCADVAFATRFAGQMIDMLAPSLIRRNFVSLGQGLRQALAAGGHPPRATASP
jgi:ribosome-associated toxin RatA of RatAB toxin-antitoxin module